MDEAKKVIEVTTGAFLDYVRMVDEAAAVRAEAKQDGLSLARKLELIRRAKVIAALAVDALKAGEVSHG